LITDIDLTDLDSVQHAVTRLGRSTNETSYYSASSNDDEQAAIQSPRRMITSIRANIGLIPK
jgi:hypothetical protein